MVIFKKAQDECETVDRQGNGGTIKTQDFPQTILFWPSWRGEKYRFLATIPHSFTLVIHCPQWCLLDSGRRIAKKFKRCGGGEREKGEGRLLIQ